MSYSKYAEQVKEITYAAGAIIMEFYKKDFAIEIKDDNSPVTQADIAANDYIVKKLKEISPEIPIVSEENSEESNLAAAKNRLFWLVDPLDGTKSFIKKTGQFTVNIALVENHRPVGGAVYVPAQNICYFTGVDAKAYKTDEDNKTLQISVRELPEDGAVVVASKSHNTPETEEFINSLPKVKERVSASSSLKFCLVAEGVADVYPRFGRTMAWDTAAGHAVVNAAGGKVQKESLEILSYCESALDNPFFIVWGH